MVYDLEDRTKKFSKEIILFLKDIKLNLINRNIVSQLSRSSTSIGANYFEANGASSKKDFRNKIYICIKEARETKYWIEILAECENCEKLKEDLRLFWKEVHELILIFGKIKSSLKN